ncbi:MAG: hypothetical protein L0229_20405 [Blastocatellia bacterium]|nr:hypothetical protein [Blastocatellia bacterium]
MSSKAKSAARLRAKAKQELARAGRHANKGRTDQAAICSATAARLERKATEVEYGTKGD